MNPDAWQTILVAALVVNAVIGLAYRVYRRTKGGPIADVWGQAILGVLLGGIALVVALDGGWARWVAVGYAALFGFVVMPIWVLGVLLPMRPRLVDYSFTVTYWVLLIAIGIAGLLA